MRLCALENRLERSASVKNRRRSFVKLYACVYVLYRFAFSFSSFSLLLLFERFFVERNLRRNVSVHCVVAIN